MPFQVSPGVITTENAYGIVARGVSTSQGALCGPSRWGPVKQIVTVSSVKKLTETFGSPDDATATTFFSGFNFLSYSDNLKFVRVIGKKARNAVYGGQGAGAQVTVNTLNGEVSSVEVTAKGAKYVIGELLRVEGDYLSHALVRVTDISSGGLIEGLELLDNGSGYENATGAALENLDDFRIENEEDFEQTANLPDVLAKYPGDLGNSLLLSVVRASEFDKWEYKNRFGLAPVAKVKAFATPEKTKQFVLDEEMAADAVVTRDGLTLEEGTEPANYNTTGTTLNIVTDTETFTADGSTNTFSLINSYKIDTNSAVVTLGSDTLQEYTGEADIVKKGEYRIRANEVEIGVDQSLFSGNSKSKTFTIVGVSGISDAEVKVDGNAFTVVATAPQEGEVKLADDGGDTVLTFNDNEKPAIGKGNVSVRYNFPTGSVNVEYGFPVETVKVFWEQTGVHGLVADRDGAFNGGEANIVLERYDNLKIAKGSKFADGSNAYYKDAINERSQFVWIGNEFTKFEDKVLSGGISDDALDSITGVTPGIHQDGYSMFKSADTVEVRHIITGAASSETVAYVINNITAKRRDCVAYISPMLSHVLFNKNRETKSILDLRTSYGNTTYAHMDCNWQKQYDRWNGVKRWVPCNGTIAGCYAAAHDQYDPWVSGAGLVRGKLRNALELAWYPDQTDRDELYPHGVNPVTRFSDDGIVVFGNKTMTSEPTPFGYMPIRFLFIVLEVTAARITRYFLFKKNNRLTWNRWKSALRPILRDAKGREGIEEYLLKADEDTNPRGQRAQKKFVGKIFVRPTDEINFAELQFNAVSGEITFEEVIAETVPTSE